ncbi:hypothetical protein [Comamonas kerstersii]|uniref:hypothetical protein n=1 Tax=Comamonas kerstersii TaxID=225992 RepID=UPI001B32B273|nr:hypothetical protein [Comamonas kerstersii]QTW19959.1 hypothetical protein H8N02_05820 [Comamonas kerstersii]
MTDTLHMLTNNKPIPINLASKMFGIDFWKSFINDDVSGGKVMTLKSPVTGAGFKVTPWLDKEKRHLVGFLIKINVPACVVGNNAFLHVLVYESAKLALMLLKEHFKSNGVCRKYLNMINLKHAVIKYLELTYLLKCDDIDDAMLKRNELEARINAIYHYIATKYRNHQGEGYDRTVYLDLRNHPFVRAYIKWHDIKENKKYGLYDGADYLGEDIKEKIYALSKSGLRIELGVSEAYLEKHHPGMSRIMAWKDKANADDVIGKVFESFRSMLRLNDNLRHNKHRPNDLAKFDQKTQDFLKTYYAGEAGPYLEGLTKNQRYELKKKILNVARIDPSIPPSKHKQLTHMKWCKQPSAPTLLKKHREIWPYVFNMENMPIFYENIKQAGLKLNNEKFDDGTSDISDLMGDTHVDEKEKTIKSKPYRGFGSLNIPNISNLTDD